ncbi:MAG TPA: PSD1 and planctomycete cytochrome C domain-containing protein [Tepidisphaeraceae bacterium]|nr:PSD1 and planctomycete cytochrome C domain-containing protein [Tepidisphaeraceae bacterium]
MPRRPSKVVILLFVTVTEAFAFAAEIPQAQQVVFFESKIRPVLIEHCYKCHSTQSEKLKAHLKLDSRDNMLKGGDSGPAIIPNQPAKSRLIEALRYTNEDMQMPPKGKLPDAVINDFATWIKMDAPWPDEKPLATTAPAVAGRSPDYARIRREHWAYQPISRRDPPPVKNAAWIRDDLDRFILAKLEVNHLQPANPASPQVLIRRIYYDLIGLPPTPTEIDEFLNDHSDDALPNLVERLLSSPRFGERWGRHWLDVARYADSTGGSRSAMIPDAWRYRDYVIESFNRDKPFNQFIREQITGDLMPADSEAQQREQLIASGYLGIGPKNLDNTDKEVLRMDVVDEQIEAVSRGILGLSVACARCHDHKFDPIPTADYYALAGIFRSTYSFVNPGNVSLTFLRPLPGLDTHADERSQYDKQLKALTDHVAKLKKDKAAAAEIKRAESQLAALKKKALPPPPQTVAVEDQKQVGDAFICIRGNVHAPGTTIPRGFLSAAPLANPPRINPKQSGRLDLADWLTRPDHPLTSRVIVNRVWHHLLGFGLVRTTDDFGTTGEPPSHPQLLDHLAIRFMEDGWSIKKLIRHIILSQTYQMSSDANTDAARIDPENRLLWRMNRKRLDAESIRDTILLVSDQLDLTTGGPVIKGDDEFTYKFNTNRRTVYVPVFRYMLHEVFEIFDFADPNLVIGQRSSSTLATQALFLMNSPFVIDQSRRAGELLLAGSPNLSDNQRLDLAYRQVLGRPPTDREREVSLAYLARKSNDWAGVYQVLFGCIDFRYLN